MCEHFFYFFYSVNNSPSFLFTFFITWTCRIINLKLETSDFCSFQIVNLIHDIIKNASLGRILPLMLCDFRDAAAPGDS